MIQVPTQGDSRMSSLKLGYFQRTWDERQPSVLFEARGTGRLDMTD